MDSVRAQDKGPADQIGQTRLPLSFGLGDSVASSRGQNSSTEALNSSTSMVHTFASKVLHAPLFMVMELLLSGNQPTKVFYLARKILEGEAS